MSTPSQVSGLRKRGRPTADERRARETEILTAALGVFLRSGYSASTVDDLAAAAQVTKRTLYAYYGDKAGVFAAMVRDLATTVSLNAASDSDTLETLAARIVIRVHSDELVGLHQLVIAESNRFPELARILHNSGDARHIARLGEHIRVERSPAREPLAEPLFSLLLGEKHRRRLLGIDPPPTPTQAAAHADAALAILGLTRRNDLAETCSGRHSRTRGGPALHPLNSFATATRQVEDSPAMTQVIVLNGGSSSGKTGIARCLQAILPRPWLRLGVDDLVDALPPSVLGSASGIAFGKQGEVSVGGDFSAAQLAWLAGVAAMARAGARVIYDDVLLGGGASQERLGASLAGLDILWVGVRCDPETAAGREVARGDRVGGMAASQATMVHEGVSYDLEVDTTHTESLVCARQIASHVRLRSAFSGR